MTVHIPVTPYIRATMTFLYALHFRKVILVFTCYLVCSVICEVGCIIIILQVRLLKLTEVAVTCPRSPYWYKACLTLH